MTTAMTNKASAKKNQPSTDAAERISVLIVEDEKDLQDLLKFNLERDGYKVHCVSSGEKALQVARDEVPDLVLLDLMLPGVDGLNVCRTLKSEPETAHVPVVMLTAKSEEADMVVGLELGADDYVTKPFSPRVLMARIKAVLRRAGQEGAGEEGQSDQVLKSGPIVVDRQRHEALLDGEPLALTATEFKLLSLMVSRPGRVFSRQQIIEAIHGGLAAVTDRSVDVQMVALRRKLGAHGEYIETVRGVGYRFKD